MQKQILREGTGLNIPLGVNAIVHYTGKFQDGNIFDSSVSRGQPFSFRLGAGQVIRGWDQGVATMKQGEKALFILPPEYAYGANGAGPIPPNSTLIFEVELLGWN